MTTYLEISVGVQLVIPLVYFQLIGKVELQTSLLFLIQLVQQASIRGVELLTGHLVQALHTTQLMKMDDSFSNFSSFLIYIHFA